MFGFDDNGVDEAGGLGCLLAGLDDQGNIDIGLPGFNGGVGKIARDGFGSQRIGIDNGVVIAKTPEQFDGVAGPDGWLVLA